MKDRIQIDGVWYVREDKAESFSAAGAKDREDLTQKVRQNTDEVGLIRYIDEGISFEAEYSLPEKEFWGIQITKFVGIAEEKVLYWDSEYFLWNLAEGNEESITAARGDLEEKTLQKLIIFLQILKEKNLLSNTTT